MLRGLAEPATAVSGLVRAVPRDAKFAASRLKLTMIWRVMMARPKSTIPNTSTTSMNVTNTISINAWPASSLLRDLVRDCQLLGRVVIAPSGCLFWGERLILEARAGGKRVHAIRAEELSNEWRDQFQIYGNRNCHRVTGPPGTSRPVFAALQTADLNPRHVDALRCVLCDLND